MASYGRIMSNGCHYLGKMANRAGGAIKGGLARPQNMVSMKRNKPTTIGRKTGY